MEQISRNIWAAISGGGAGYKAAQQILRNAISTGILDEKYCNVNGRHRGDALNYDIYDYMIDVILVQRRHTTWTKWGNSPQKDYYILVLLPTGGIMKIEAPHKMAIVRSAKLNLPAGDIIRKITRKQSAEEIFAHYVAQRMGGA